MEGQGIQRNKRGCMGALGCLLVVSLAINLVVLGGALIFREKPGPVKRLNEVWLSGKGESKLAVVRVTGPIMEGPRSTSSMTAASDVVRQLQRAGRDKGVKGVLLIANSPGGGVTASDKIYNSVKAFVKKKPLVMIMEDVCASGCVYLSAHATKILAHPTSITGSIGVITSTFNVSKMLDKIGVNAVTIASKENKALLSPFEPVKPEHKAILKKIIDEMYTRFVNVLVQGRKIPKEKLLPFADGRIFTGTVALKHKLIDGLGYRKDALKELMKLANVSSARLVQYRPPFSFYQLFRATASLPEELKSSRSLSLEKALNFKAPRVLYMWSGK